MITVTKVIRKGKTSTQCINCHKDAPTFELDINNTITHLCLNCMSNLEHKLHDAFLAAVNDEEPDKIVKDCPYLNNSCSGNSKDHSCVGCNVWIAEHHPEQLPTETLNNIFEYECWGTKNCNRCELGEECLTNSDYICNLKCQYLHKVGRKRNVH